MLVEFSRSHIYLLPTYSQLECSHFSYIQSIEHLSNLYLEQVGVPSF